MKLRTLFAACLLLAASAIAHAGAFTDYAENKLTDAERGRACVEFWLGYARARGIRLAIAKTSSLMDALHPRAERLYGYDTVDVDIQATADGQVRVGFTPRDTLPTADKIEARYDHSAHPNALVTG